MSHDLRAQLIAALHNVVDQAVTDSDTCAICQHDLARHASGCAIPLAIAALNAAAVSPPPPPEERCGLCGEPRAAHLKKEADWRTVPGCLGLFRKPAPVEPSVTLIPEVEGTTTAIGSIESFDAAQRLCREIPQRPAEPSVTLAGPHPDFIKLNRWAAKLRLDASGECGRMAMGEMYALADYLVALAASRQGQNG